MSKIKFKDWELSKREQLIVSRVIFSLGDQIEETIDMLYRQNKPFKERRLMSIFIDIIKGYIGCYMYQLGNDIMHAYEKEFIIEEDYSDVNKHFTWKDIEGYEGLYQVSNHGRVRSLKRGVLKPFFNNDHLKNKVKGITVRLYKKGNRKTHSVDNLVLKTYGKKYYKLYDTWRNTEW